MRTTEDAAVFSRQIERMFSAIAPRYDFLNRLLSLGQDRSWRRKAVDRLHPKPGDRFVDVATGTGDVALEIARRFPACVSVAGVDFSYPMLKLGIQKVRARQLDGSIFFHNACAEHLPYGDGLFNGAVSAFGVRNFSRISQGLAEMARVLQPGGRIVVLEFSLPRSRVLRAIYKGYFNFILPWIGRRVSGHRDAYSYLPSSVSNFPGQREFARLLEESGFSNVSCIDLSLGIVTLYSGTKHA